MAILSTIIVVLNYNMTSVASGYNRTNSLHSNPKVDASTYHTFNPRATELSYPLSQVTT